MVIFIDGPQLSGKTTLIEGVKRATKKLKFPFGEISKDLGFSNQESVLKGFQVGKDLSALYFISSLVDKDKEDILVDRGPFSSIYYSLAKERMTLKEVSNFSEKVAEFGGDFRYIFVLPKNRPALKRNKFDGFDGLDSFIDPIAQHLIKVVADANRLDCRLFFNDFSKPIEENVKKFERFIYS